MLLLLLLYFTSYYRIQFLLYQCWFWGIEIFMQQTQWCFYSFIISNIRGKCFLSFYWDKSNTFLGDKNTCVISCEFLNKVYYYYYYYYYLIIVIIITIIIIIIIKRDSIAPLLLAFKKGDDYATTISWIKAKVFFAILRSALLCLRETRRKRRAANISDFDITSESAQSRI